MADSLYHKNTPVRVDVDAPQPLDIQIPNNRSRSERWKVLAFGILFQLMIDMISLPLFFAYDKNRLKISVNTGHTGNCRLLVYIPKGIDNHKVSPRGVAMHLNGGGWTISRPETEAPICRYLADKIGIIVVAPDYRKAPRYPYPHALEQLYQVLSWISIGGLKKILESSRADFPPINSTRIALSGGSAGSNLACALTTLCVSRPLPNDARIMAQGLLYPALNLAVPYADKLARVDPSHVLPQWMSRFFLYAYLPPPRTAIDPLVSPALASDEVIRQFPPTVILTAAYDYLAYEAEEFAARLRSEGVDVQNQRFEDVGHGFDGIPTYNKKRRMLNHAARDRAWGLIADIFQRVLH